MLQSRQKQDLLQTKEFRAKSVKSNMHVDSTVSAEERKGEESSLQRGVLLGIEPIPPDCSGCTKSEDYTKVPQDLQAQKPK